MIGPRWKSGPDLRKRRFVVVGRRCLLLVSAGLFADYLRTGGVCRTAQRPGHTLPLNVGLTPDPSEHTCRLVLKAEVGVPARGLWGSSRVVIGCGCESWDRRLIWALEGDPPLRLCPYDRLHQAVVVGVADGADRGSDALQIQGLGEPDGGVLTGFNQWKQHRFVGATVGAR
jgi:hypothetical protein